MNQKTEITGDNTTKAVEAVLTQVADGQRKGVLADIERTLGIVPAFFKMMPPTHLESEWRIFKEFQLSDKTSLPPKVKELIGLAVAAQMQCQYCTYFHTVAAGMHGATAEELNEALLMGKHTAGWSTFLAGARYDLEQLKKEMGELKSHMAKQRPSPRPS
jgi:AhpD family alkylhydroperoxidase